jgi:nucleoside-diphosphate-sugar epimerase
MEDDSRIYVAGHRGLAGSALVRSLERHGFGNLIFRTHAQLGLKKPEAVPTSTRSMFSWPRPRSAASTPIKPAQRILSATICRFRPA